MTTETPEVTHQETSAGGEFTIGREGVMTYRTIDEGHILVNHTKVASQSEGKGLARKLYHAMVAHAREHQLKVTPTCSYVVAMFERFPEDHDVLK